MSLIQVRDAVAFPGGSNSSDTVIDNVHFNLTTLNFWNYTLYSNGTLSNGSWCLLTFPPYTPPLLLENGTFINATWCYSPVKGIQHRAAIAIGYAVVFGIALVLTLVSLNKHARLYLPAEKRFYPIGRRWQWYWAIWVCATALISLLTCIDVDRYFLPELPIILTSFFWYLMQIGAIAVVWEAVRHWGSWMERQFTDPDPFALRDGDRRSKVEFWLPLWFYLFLWLNFFMIVPRNWEPIQHQRYPQQVVDEAIPTATDARFKTAAFLLAVCWLTTVFSLRHSIKHYCPRNRGILNRISGFLRYTPARFMIILPLAAVVPVYQALVAWHFAWSPLNIDGLDAAIYPGAYTPALLIVLVQAYFGLLLPNEDKELLRQRRVRDQALDREMGIVHKPSWWRRINGEHIAANESMSDRLARNVREVQGNRQATTRNPDGIDIASGPVEMTPVSPPPPASPRISRTEVERYSGKSDRGRTELAAGLMFPQAGERAAAQRHEDIGLDDAAPPPYQPEGDPGTRPAPNVERSATSNSTDRPPQQIRSMLDV